MLSIPRDLEKYLSGVVGESVFHEPVYDLLTSIADEFEAEGMASIAKRMGNCGDERSKVLLAALASEAVVDKVLAAVMPLYRPELVKSLDMKIFILKALALVPKHLTEAADLIRQVRNKFAHKLTVEKLNDLDDAVRGNVVMKMRQYYVRLRIEPKDKCNDRMYVFDAIAQIATVGMWTYLPLLHDLNETVRNPTLENELRLQAQRRLEEQTKAVLAHVQAPAPLGEL